MTVALALLAAALTAPAPELPRGQVIPKIICAANPAETYSLYLPSSYRSGRAWPVLYAFDSRGIDNDRDLIELFRPGAERFGFVVASSGNSTNVRPMEDNFRSLGAIWTDTHARLALDDRRAYAFGFSGMSRFTTMAAIRAPGTLAGVIGASGGFPVGHPPSRETSFPFFGLAGDRDFNYYEMLDLEAQLAAAGVPHRIDIFDGSHQWPTEELVTRALGWMELQAMKQGTRAKDPGVIEALWAEDLARARALQGWRAWRVWTAMAADFAGLRDVSEAEKQAAALAADPAFQRDRKEREARDRRDREYLERAPRLFNAVPAEAGPEGVRQLLTDLQIPDLKKREKSSDSEERLSAARLLYAVYIQTGLYLPRTYMERKQWDQAILFLEVAAEVDPDSPRIPYRLATAWAGKGNRKRALEELARAVERNGTDLAEIEADPALAPLWQDEGYRELIARLKGKS